MREIRINVRGTNDVPLITFTVDQLHGTAGGAQSETADYTVESRTPDQAAGEGRMVTRQHLQEGALHKGPYVLDEVERGGANSGEQRHRPVERQGPGRLQEPRQAGGCALQATGFSFVVNGKPVPFETGQ